MSLESPERGPLVALGLNLEGEAWTVRCEVPSSSPWCAPRESLGASTREASPLGGLTPRVVERRAARAGAPERRAGAPEWAERRAPAAWLCCFVVGPRSLASTPARASAGSLTMTAGLHLLPAKRMACATALPARGELDGQLRRHPRQKPLQDTDGACCSQWGLRAVVRASHTSKPPVLTACSRMGMCQALCLPDLSIPHQPGQPHKQERSQPPRPAAAQTAWAFWSVRYGLLT